MATNNIQSTAMTNSGLATIKKQHNIEIPICGVCGYPTLIAYSNIKNVITITPKSQRIINPKIELKCLSCKNIISRTASGIIIGANSYNAYDDEFKQAVQQLYQKIKSPSYMEFTFKSFCFSKPRVVEGEKRHDLYVYCEDANGKLFRFSNESAKKIIYFAVKDRKFKACVALQKTWGTANVCPYPNKVRALTNYRTVLKILGGIELI